MFKFISIASVLALGACTGQREVYNNNGLVLVQAGADPTPINGGYNVLIKEQNGVSTVLAVTATGTVAEQVAMPAAIVGGAAVLRPDKTELTDNSTVKGGDTNVAGGSTRNGNNGRKPGHDVVTPNIRPFQNDGTVVVRP